MDWNCFWSWRHSFCLVFLSNSFLCFLFPLSSVLFPLSSFLFPLSSFLSIIFVQTIHRLVVGILHGPATTRVETVACFEQTPAGQLRTVGQSTRVVGGVLVCIGKHVCVHHLPGFPALQHCHGGDRVLHWYLHPTRRQPRRFQHVFVVEHLRGVDVGHDWGKRPACLLLSIFFPPSCLLLSIFFRSSFNRLSIVFQSSFNLLSTVFQSSFLLRPSLSVVFQSVCTDLLDVLDLSLTRISKPPFCSRPVPSRGKFNTCWGTTLTRI